MRRIVFQLDDRPEVTGEVGLDNEGNLYLRGNVGQSIRLLQDTSNVGDYVPETSNLRNVLSMSVQNGGYAVLGKQVMTTLAFTLETPEGEVQVEFEVTVPIPVTFSGDASETAEVFSRSGSFGGGANPTWIVTPVPGTNRVNVNLLGNPFLIGEYKYQLGFCYQLP